MWSAQCLWIYWSHRCQAIHRYHRMKFVLKQIPYIENEINASPCQTFEWTCVREYILWTCVPEFRKQWLQSSSLRCKFHRIACDMNYIISIFGCRRRILIHYFLTDVVVNPYVYNSNATSGLITWALNGVKWMCLGVIERKRTSIALAVFIPKVMKGTLCKRCTH